MESLSRPPHRRKHSSTNGFSFKNPYDDVFLSNRGERESLEAHEYAEIFSGSSSIPVIDLSGLDERVEPGDCRSSKLDYGNIFGGFRNGDVAVPYEELFNGSAKKTKLRTPTDTRESRSSHSSEMPKIPSDEASNQSADGVKKQFNVSFNKTGQKNTDAANGKTHIAQLKAVPGFAYVVDETPRQQKTEDGKTVNSLKRDVSRTWSFSAEVETDKGKGGLNGKDPLIPNKPYNANDINLKSNISKVSPLSSSPSNVSGNNDPSQLRESNLVAKGKGGLNGKDSPIPNKSFNVNDVNLKSNFSKVPSLSSSPSNISGNNDPNQLREPNFVAKGEGGLNGNDSPIPNNSFDANDVNLKSNFSKVSSPSSSPSNISGNNDSSQLRESNFVSKEESLRKDAGEFSPPYLGEDFDEHSVAAASAAALKKAIDQAQESIRLAKMIMDRKKEGYQNGSKLRQRDRSEVLDKEGKTHRGSYGSKKKNSKEKFQELDPTFTAFNEIAVKFTPSLSHNNTFISDAKIEMERVWENVEAAKEHETVFLGGGKLFSSYGSERESLNIDEKVELKKTGKNVEAEEADFPVLIANECEIADLVSDKVGTSSSLLPSTSELESHPWRLETGEYNLEEREATVYHTKGSEFVAELIESPVDTSQRINVEEAEQCRATYAQESENKMERVPSTSQITRGQEKVLGESGKNFGISLEDDVSEERENKMDDKRNQEPEEMLVLEQFTELRSKLDNFLHESCNLGENETLGQVGTESKSEIGCERKENGHIGESFEDDDHLWFESEEQLKETVEDELYDAEPGAFQETGEVENKFNETLELETENQTQNHAHDADEPRLPEELEHNKVEERHVNTFAMRAKIKCYESEARNNAVSCDSPETNYTPGGDRRTEESVNNCQYEANAYAEHIDGAVNVNTSSASTICSDVQTDDTSTVISGTQEEASNNDLDNKSEECQRGHKNYRENDTLSEATETFCVTDKYKDSEHLFHLEDDNEIPGTETLRRIASEEIFVESELHDAFDSPPDGKMEHVPDLDPEDELPEDQDTSISTIEIHDVDQGYTSKINEQDLPQVHASDIREAEFDFADVRQASGQTSESDEGSVSTSSHENINGFSAHESEECGENANNVNPNSDELKDKLELVSDVGKSAEEQSEPKTMEKEKPMETERAVEKDLKTETNDENFVGSSPIEEKDVKADPQNSDKTDYQQRIEAIKRGREREKDRIVVERAIREARERAFAEARERAERAAVERAASEARQRAMTEAREKLDKASMEAKRKSERAAVERATAEARERALEKAMSQKTIRTEGKTTESVSGSSRSNGLKQSFSSSDLENVTESAQRRKARLERHQRIMERAAKALAEKNMRDLLVQKEQAERNRLAESLDADIKRWATGKEGNLRALLSTLQYILGPTSGWQPIPLTEIVTTAAVKKAYRKATLYVHPDKLQQRGASIKQKYLCEKIFDLLKAAWNRFNSDER